MGRFKKYNPVFVSLLLYFFLWKLLQPVLGFMLDSDAVAYLTIARRVSEGDYLTSVNGLWSPLNSWLIAPFIAHGWNAWSIAMQMNLLFGAIILVLIFFLFQRFRISDFSIYLLQLTSAVVLVYFVYFQMFGDVLQLLFVLIYLQIIFRRGGEGIRYRDAVLSGMIMGLAFYAKAYSMFFFGLHFLVVVFVQSRIFQASFRKKIMIYFTGVLVMTLMILPWVFVMHLKYGTWAASHAGTLNMSWYINSGKSFKADINLLIPPSYQDSPSFWEDPYLSQENLSSPFTSPYHFARWILRVMHTCMICLFCFNEISIFSLAILCISFFYFFYVKKKNGEPDDIANIRVLVLTIMVLPLGYLMMHIETRYIWLNVFLLMILAVILLDKYFSVHPFKRSIQLTCYCILIGSFLVFPVYQFENLKFKNKNLFATADFLRQNNICGKWTSNVTDAGSMWVVAYLTGSHYYTIEKSSYSSNDLLKEMKRYGVKYYLYDNPHNHSDVEMAGLKFLVQFQNFSIYEIE